MSDKNKEKDDKGLLESIKLIVSKEDKIKDQVESDRGLERYAKDLLLLMSLVKDYYQGNYRNIPYRTISAAVIGLLYVLNPIDLIPDFIPFIGHIDDALVLKFCLKRMEKDLSKYKKWKNEQTAANDKNTNKNMDSKEDKDSKAKGKEEKKSARKDKDSETDKKS
ncbi:YkvA family protein [uncultured Psychrobacter sp.]|uniref:YkvA family protein n=1 Tax=uncultured Psychrobacter sp. TaxID=259303 RepID=UPI0026256B2B|nr:YkvA family protein [uncultured Psychrobacter sp.]